MDLRLPDATPTAAERAAIDALLGAPGSGWDGGSRGARDAHTAQGGHAARGRRHLLLPALEAVQARVGWISQGAFSYVCERLTVPPADAYGVATFYALLPTVPRPPRVVHVCDDIACRLKGATQPHADDRIPSPCLGLCDQAPAALFTEAGEQPIERSFGNATAAAITRVMNGDLDPTTTPRLHIPQAGDPALRLLRRVDVVDPASLDDYKAHGGYEPLRRAIEIGPEGVIREVTDSRLMGRGGAAFPTGRKWDAVARQPVRPHYLVCNADESEPGTFKDRVLMESDPFGVIEAMTIAAYATGCERGYIYLRGEYPLARERLQHAIEMARARGLLGSTVMGQLFAFDIEIRRGAGAYICGEETAIFNSIEGLRGEPRNKPPFPVQAGLFGKPTVVNNVETLVNVLEILRIGGPAYATIGTEGSTGTRLFCLSGHVSRPGVYEVAFGIDAAGPDRPGGRRGRRPKQLQAILLGGAAGVFVRPDELDCR